MARRVFTDEPMSRLATWSSRLALFALVVAVLSVIILRSGLLEIVPSLATFGAALIFAGLAVLLALASFVVIWRQGLAGLGRALLGLFLGALLLAYPGYLASRAMTLPALYDITTDPANPPRFDALARARPSNRNTYPGDAAAQRQRAAYPEVVPLQLNVQPKVAYDIALALVTKRKWQVADSRPPIGRREAVIEATARTLIMGFRDDVVIRVSQVGTGSRVDIRAASRFGMHDFGANAARVRALLDDIDDAAGSAPEPRPEPEPPKKPEKPDKKSPLKRPPPKR